MFPDFNDMDPLSSCELTFPDSTVTPPLLPEVVSPEDSTKAPDLPEADSPDDRVNAVSYTHLTLPTTVRV